MWGQLFCVLPLILASLAIKVPVSKEETPVEDTDTQKTPIYYTSDDGNLDSYLIPPDTHRQEEVASDVVTPATYLLPPSPEKQTDYYNVPIQSTDQSDWYPISAQSESAPEVKQKIRAGKHLNNEKLTVPVPADYLEPPAVNAPDDYTIPPPLEELELPDEEIKQQFNSNAQVNYVPVKKIKQKSNPVLIQDVPILFRLNAKAPTLASHLVPPNAELSIYKNPTKLYPKKYPGTFEPVPIPIGQFSEDGLVAVPRAKPVKLFNPAFNTEGVYLTPSEEKKRFLYDQAEQKRKLKEEEAAKQLHLAAADTYGNAAPTEQEASESLQRYPSRPAPLKQVAAPVSQNNPNIPPPSDERTEFRMHGMKGPHSYQFGYDTGKGKNRQFRYEERDNDGYVKGHYGYMDKHGKLRVVNYRAHPEHGFQADAEGEKE